MDWEKYVQECADEYGVDVSVAMALFEVLGENEAYDGFLTALEDVAMMGEE